MNSSPKVINEQKPVPLSVEPDGVPSELKEHPRWMVWRYEPRANKRDKKTKWTKVPYESSNPRMRAKSTNSTTWGMFDEALARWRNGECNGIGFALGDGWSGVDLDFPCFDGDGALTERARTIVEPLHSYTERSPSGEKLHVLTRGALPHASRRRRTDDIEMYSEGRYFTVTGQHLAGTPTTVEDRAAELATLHASVFGDDRNERTRATAETRPRESSALVLSPSAEQPKKLEALLENFESARRTWEGKRPDLTDPSPSGYDLALANILVKAEYTDQEIVSTLIALRRRNGWALKLRDDYFRRTIQKARAVQTSTNITEDELALEFTELHRNELLFVDDWNRWPRWDGTRWRIDRTREVFDLARKVCRDAAARAASEIKPHERKRLLSAQTVAAVVRLACADRAHARVNEDFDRDPMRLNTPEATINLHTGVLYSHRCEDLITKSTAVAPGGNCPLWLASLSQWTAGDRELMEFLKRLVGYCLTGQTREHVFGFFYGEGANGKGTFLNLLSWLLGDYAAVAPMEAFLESKNERHSTELAMLRGAHLVTAQEIPEGRQWDTKRIQQVTGGDPITARFMRAEFFTYIPQFTLLVSGNKKPELRSVNEAMRRRLLLIPFTVTITKAQRDQHLSERLRAEAPGILAWAIAGCLEWQRSGLRPPSSVTVETNEYFSDQDGIGRWLDERCVIGQGHAPKRTLYESWSQWATLNRAYDPGMRRLLAELRSRLDVENITLGKANTEALKGIRLATEEGG